MRKAVLVAVLALVYFAAAKIGLSLAYAAEQVTLVWPPTGIALVALLRFGNVLWPGIALGAFFANATANEPLATAAGIALGNTLEAVVGASLLKRLGFQPSLERFRDVLWLVGGAGVVSTTLSATIGVTSLCLGGLEPWARFETLWLVWWVGDGMGVLIFAPPLLTWMHSGKARWHRYALAEVAALVLGLAAISSLLLAMERTPVLNAATTYVVFPFVIWAATRFQQRGSTLIVLLVATTSTWGTAHGVGPFARGTLAENLFLQQSFMAVVALTGLVLAATSAARRTAERRVRESHRLLQSVSEGTTDAIFVKDLEGRYLMINSAGAALLGKPVHEVLGKDDSELFSAETAAEIMRRDRVTIQEGKTSTYEEVGTAAGATRTYLSTKGPYRDADGRTIGLLGVARDITQQKLAEEELSQLLERESALRAEADAANRQKDEFLSLLGHELRNPLAPIANALAILNQDQRPETLSWALEVMRRQVHHLTRLVDDLLDVSRITSGRIELRPQATDLVLLVEQAVEASRPFIEARKHRLHVSLPDAPVPLFADATRLEQVVVNLLNNAAKYTEQRGNIWVSAEALGDHALLRVRDDGRGIALELLPRVFELFTQADRTLARSEGGLGVGLTLVRKLVTLHGGSVTARSEGAGRGSEFVVTLPLHHRDSDIPAGSEGHASPPEKKRSFRVLVVEDNPDSARSLALLLELLGHEVRVVHDGPSALEAVSSFHPAVVLLDIGLPGMDGYEVARRIRSAGKEVKLVSLSGYSDPRDAGFDHQFIKPVEAERLVELFASLG